MKIDSEEPGNFFRNLLWKKNNASKIRMPPENPIPVDLRSDCKRGCFSFHGFK
jgi:hypothetical protein